MIRSRRIGKRYLAGFVAAAALFHLAAIALATYVGWPNEGRTELALLLLVLGIAPASLAIFFARKAWITDNETSAAYSSAGLVVLLLALILAHLGPLPR
jgi:hypothetical protein